MIGKQNIFHSARGERWYCVVFLDGKKGPYINQTGYSCISFVKRTLTRYSQIHNMDQCITK